MYHSSPTNVARYALDVAPVAAHCHNLGARITVGVAGEDGEGAIQLQGAVGEAGAPEVHVGARRILLSFIAF